MSTIQWHGPPPGTALRTELSAAGLTVSKGGSARVLRAGTLPAGGTPESPWLWVVDRAVPLGAKREAIDRGCYDVICTREHRWAHRLAARVAELAQAEPKLAEAPGLITRSPAAQRMVKQIAQVARTSMPVLLFGETGTGKELAARLIHQWSARRAGPFVPVNCAAIPNDLMEGELFGYAKGAFSGAVRRYDGQLMAAQGGTVFLDEVDDTPPPLQVKLLRVLEDRVVNRLGETEPHHVDFRILAATNRDLRQLIAKGVFAADFYERLAICSIQLPPLRERLEDLAELASHLIERFYREEPSSAAWGRVESVSEDALEALRAYPWPGNIRELRNVLFAALVAKRGGRELLLSDLPERVHARQIHAPSGALIDRDALEKHIDHGQFNLRSELERVEALALQIALRRAEGNAAHAARLLGEVGRGTSHNPGATVRAMSRRLRRYLK